MSPRKPAGKSKTKTHSKSGKSKPAPEGAGRSPDRGPRPGRPSHGEARRNEPEPSGGFSFRDRSGKLHTPKNARKTSEPSSARPEPLIPSGSGRPSGPVKSRGPGTKPGPTGQIKKNGPSAGADEPSREDWQVRRNKRKQERQEFEGKRSFEGKHKAGAPTQSRFTRDDRGGSSGGRDGGKSGRGGGRNGSTGRDRNDRGRDSGSRGDQRGGRDQQGRGGRGGRANRGADTGETRTLKGTVDKNRKGFGFLIFEDRKIEDSFVPPRMAESLFHGDRVEAVISSRGDVIELRVLEHRFREAVGRFTPHPSGPHRGGFVLYERKKAREEIFIAKNDKGAKLGDWVMAKLEFHESGPYPVTGEITEVYGPELPASADIQMVAAEYNLIEEHSDAADAEAKQFKLEVDLTHREDLRKVPFITIDGETARDFDDAVYVERNKSGYVLWVAIADVSHYVTPGTALDKDAQSRGTSVYFPERAFHMLPRALSESLCSLKPNEPRLTMVSKIQYDHQGKKTGVELMEAVIESHRRATYNQIQDEWEKNQKNKDWEFLPHFELYQMLRKSRTRRGSIDFDLPEAEVKCEKTGEVISIKHRPRVDSHRLIEEFMIAANESVTEWALEREWPFIYRVHEEPAEKNLEKFAKLAANFGVKFSLSRENISQTLAEFVTRIEGHPASLLLNMSLLRSMKQAIYTALHGIHFGLASEAYTHFTSPIRRYPDLVVHRQLRRALRADKGTMPKLKDAERASMEKDLEEIAEHCSYRERIASDAERESIRLKQVRAMIPHVGDDFEGSVVGMIESGIFVRINDPYVEGMVSQESMNDDFYEFDEEKMVFRGRRKKKTFRIGDPVNVRCLKASIDSRQIDFGLVTDE